MRSKTIAIKVKIALLSALFIFIYLIIFDFLLAALFQDAAWLGTGKAKKMAFDPACGIAGLPACQPGNQGKHKK